MIADRIKYTSNHDTLRSWCGSLQITNCLKPRLFNNDRNSAILKLNGINPVIFQVRELFNYVEQPVVVQRAVCLSGKRLSKALFEEIEARPVYIQRVFVVLCEVDLPKPLGYSLP